MSYDKILAFLSFSKIKPVDFMPLSIFSITYGKSLENARFQGFFNEIGKVIAVMFSVSKNKKQNVFK